jgi:type I restriction-modification system DNA methylase subunit
VRDGEDEKEWQLLLFKKTQKLLDRMLFIFFAEDCGLLPPNSMVQIIDQWEQLKEIDEYRPFYDRVKKYFGYMNTGFQGKNYEVFAYNGGLFKPDEILDGLTISDEVLMRYCKKISDYDFQSDVDVNILGHIFENSLTEIEEITTKLQQGEAPTISKRKKDGVFYTPQYITKYIVENTVGKLCREKKAELGIDESEYFTDKKRQVATKKALIEKLDAYRDWLLQISICDPACGSGAFLNAALNFLIAEHKIIKGFLGNVDVPCAGFDNEF